MTQNKVEYKRFSSMVTKIDEDQGIVEHIVAVMGNVDLGGDIIHPGAFTKTINERMGKIRVLDNHNSGSVMFALGKPIAMREISRNQLPQSVKDEYPEATGALWVTTQFLLTTPEGKGAFERLKMGAIDEWSIGYRALDVDFSAIEAPNGEEITVRNLRTIKLYEYSPVLFAMNPATTTETVKASDETLFGYPVVYIDDELIDNNKNDENEFIFVAGKRNYYARLTEIKDENDMRAQTDEACEENENEIENEAGTDVDEIDSAPPTTEDETNIVKLRERVMRSRLEIHEYM
jgi:HK97 family phage prohead protease